MYRKIINGYTAEKVVEFLVDNEGKFFEYIEPSVNTIITGASFAYSNGHLILSSFLGDRKVCVIGLDGKIKSELIFGKSDPIPKPYKVTDPRSTPGAKSYITKIEYHQNSLFILLDNVIWILNYPTYETKEVLRIVRNPEEKTAPVIDFSITDIIMYLRIGHDGLYSIKTNPSWFY